MPDLIRLYVQQVAIGFGAAAVFVVLLLGFDIAGLRHLVAVSADGPLAIFLLWMFNGIVFAGVQFAISIMRMAGDDRDDDDDDDQGGHHARELIPVRVLR